MYYFDSENKKLLRYYANYKGQNFKTKEEFDEYIKTNNLKVESQLYFKKSKYTSESSPVFDGKWESCELPLGTVLYDERDYSRYTFETEEAANEFLDYVKKVPDTYIQVCPYTGYEGEDDSTSIDNQVKQIVAKMPKEVTTKFDESTETKVFVHLIVSYLPENEIIRAKRVEALSNLVINIKDITPTARILINAQNYKDEEYLDDPQVTYLFKHEKGIGAQAARNELLKYFYESDYEYAILHDDDSFLNPTDSAKDFFKELALYPQKFTKIPMDVCYSRNMLFIPRDEADVAKAKFRGKVWDFVANPSSWLCWSIFRNFKKAYNEEYYLDEGLDPLTGKGFDDTEFSYRVSSRRQSWTLPQLELLLQCQDESDSSLFSEVVNPLYRIRSIKGVRDKFLPLKENGLDWDYAAFRNKLNQPPYYAVPREVIRDVAADYSEEKLTARIKENFEEKVKQFEAKKINRKAESFSTKLK